MLPDKQRVKTERAFIALGISFYLEICFETLTKKLSNGLTFVLTFRKSNARFKEKIQRNDNTIIQKTAGVITFLYYRNH